MEPGARAEVLIVGASVAGLTTAETLRGEGFTGGITMVGDEDTLPYGRPPLSKQVLAGTWAPEASALCGDADLDRLGVRFVRGVAATSLDPADRVVTTSSGGRLRYGTLVVATGASARRLPFGTRLAGVHRLRTRADARALRADLATARRAVVVGAGVLGAEVAAGLRASGASVTLVGRSSRVRLGQAGALLSSPVTRLLRGHGVDVRLAEDVVGLGGRDRVCTVTLSSGAVVQTDLVVAAVGCVPNTGWLASSGLDVSAGVVCDSAGRAASDVYAAGDVAAWTDPRTGLPVRVEHHLNAAEQARTVARTIATGTPPHTRPVPFFWSEFFGTRIQVFGRCTGTTLHPITGDDTSNRFVATTHQDGIVTAVVGWNMPRTFHTARSLVGRPTAALASLSA